MKFLPKMTIKLSKQFQLDLINQVYFIYKDKPQAALKFRKEIIKNLRKDLKHPFSFKKSVYFDNETIRDYVFKGYTCVYEIDVKQNAINVFGFIKYKSSL
jgi:plasmid stabilization system protein ParE